MSAPDLVPPGTTGGGAPVGGSGTIGTIPKWATTTTLGNSVITESSAGNVGVNANLVGVSTPDRLIIGAPAGALPFGIIIGRNYAEGAGRARLGLGDDQRGIGLSGTDHTVVHAYSSNSILFGHGTPTSLAAKMTILPSGNVGIGTTSPASVLDVAGTITCDDVSTGIKLPASPGNADVQTLDCYAESTYMATDTSGAGLTFTLNNAAVCTRVGRLVFVRVDITYPVTADTSYASLSVPFTSIVNGGTAAAYGGMLGTCLILANASAFEVYALAPLTRQTNAGLSGVRLAFTICFQAL